MNFLIFLNQILPPLSEKDIQKILKDVRARDKDKKELVCVSSPVQKLH